MKVSQIVLHPLGHDWAIAPSLESNKNFQRGQVGEQFQLPFESAWKE
jgi:hypothetical protein